MMQYTNKFSCTVNERKDEFVVAFAQEHPIVLQDGTVTGVESEDITTVVMTRDCASALVNAVGTLLNRQD